MGLNIDDILEINVLIVFLINEILFMVFSLIFIHFDK